MNGSKDLIGRVVAVGHQYRMAKIQISVDPFGPVQIKVEANMVCLISVLCFMPKIYSFVYCTDLFGVGQFHAPNTYCASRKSLKGKLRYVTCSLPTCTHSCMHTHILVLQTRCAFVFCYFKLANAICISSALHRKQKRKKTIAHSMVVRCACVTNPRKHLACNEVLPRAPQMCVQGLSGSTITLVACVSGLHA